MSKFVIVDGNAIVHRAFHAIPPMTGKNGLVLNAVYGFTSILLRTIKELQPDYLVVAFDLKAPTFRHLEYKEYKAQRVKQPQELYDQMVLVKELLRAMQVPVLEQEGFEADDIIATVAVNNKKEKVKTIIVTGDMDTLQLVDEDTEVYTMKKGVNDIVVYNTKAVEERYGLKPEQMIDYKALRGDPSDNIPGVKGIGEKTAADLIQKFGTLENLYKNKNKLAEKKVSAAVIAKILSGEKEALFSKHLVTLVSTVPVKYTLKDCEAKDFINPQMKELLAKWEFGSLLKRLDIFENGTPQEEKKVAKTTKIKVIEIKTKEDFKELERSGAKSKKCAIYLSDDGASSLKAKLFGLVLTFDGTDVFYLPSSLIEKFDKNLLQNKSLIVHDFKRTNEILERYGWSLENEFFDLMIADYLLDQGSRSHEISSLILRYLNKEAGISNQASLFGIDAKTLGQTVVDFWSIGKILEEELEDKGFSNLYKKMEMPLVNVLAEMEKNGIKIDVAYMGLLAKQMEKRGKELTDEIYKMAGQEFNIASPQQLKEILFDKLEIPVMGIRKGKTGLSTAASELEKMRGLHPIIELIFEYRELAKLRNTYVDVLPGLVEKDGRVHTTFNQAVTATGRLSSSNPNLQNIPIKGDLGQEIRKCFVAEKGHKLLGLDYSQIELRIIASLANDPEMIKIFQEGRDIHAMTAARVNGITLAEVTPVMRSNAKAINFGIIYGMGPHSLAESINVSFMEAKDFIARYFAVFKEVKKFLDETRSLAHSTGYVETLLGRRRYLSEINSGMPQLRNSAERMAVNAPIQGTAADLIKLAMIEVHKLLKDKSEIKMLLQVHDELVFEVKEEAIKKYADPIQTIMENVLKLRVPIKVEVEAGDNWGEMKEI
ncbi:MAG: polymerase protein [Candidatus Magasanikbacteria bacterium GW2011_GWC2_40_17]|uniref:DNA polymerase I n=1 Tax=Candidatus Magasanikbacteria bacterium GW2011_GWA2_42_32 TaxID=1619039 RepID=A0A0G1A7P7_9BACT|nr:MAG: polymerase protein [Candidatus Magasanikbacteria bacterium GW2011_GWC2_40_17]KKS57070.1 MAG: polymerase protein [Candidatus Magasanikbacteria bacterium GW2011_GWA2_42_32]OGH85403.1 MAG: DNA polymerase I [Candidatus Magasanikbacteria bacterium RIFOXYB2_FULL_38_10]